MRTIAQARGTGTPTEIQQNLKSKSISEDGSAYRVAIQHTDATPTVVHVHPPRPLIVTEENCETGAGLQKRAWAKTARDMRALGFRVSRTSDGYSALLSDVEAFFREHAEIATERARVHPERIKPEPVLSEADEARAALENVGVRFLPRAKTARR